jgi:hypothetical protein
MTALTVAINVISKTKKAAFPLLFFLVYPDAVHVARSGYHYVKHNHRQGAPGPRRNSADQWQLSNWQIHLLLGCASGGPQVQHDASCLILKHRGQWQCLRRVADPEDVRSPVMPRASRVKVLCSMPSLLGVMMETGFCADADGKGNKFCYEKGDEIYDETRARSIVL